MSDVTKALGIADASIDASVGRLFEWLRIPSISTDPAFAADCRRAAEWAAETLRGIGFDASVRRTIGHPMVVGHWRSGLPNARKVLFYGHYDVQPPDPLGLWTSAPFDPVLVDGIYGPMIVARGSSDDKGQVMTIIEACRALLQADGRLPIDVTVFLEGEEEADAVSMAPFLTENRDELRADIALICDTGMWDRDTPAITTMLRGTVYEEVLIEAATMDLHSGMFGGAAQNPINVLTRILGALHDDQGRITIPGFYDGVEELSDAMRADWAALNFDEAAFLRNVGLSVPAGEQGRSVLEQITVRPTCDINGISGGYQGEGAKTVIAAKASAKISFRLVAKQDPEKIQAAFRAFVSSRLPADCKVTFLSHGKTPAVSVPSDSADLRRARVALEAEWGCSVPLIGTGGSIPVVGDFQRYLGMSSLLIGFALDDDRIHSPNEKYELRSFQRGIRSWIRVLAEIGKS
jgi:acetylornithine deacetylase/succinyl-diaminopimelate desuccinylase-like protein